MTQAYISNYIDVYCLNLLDKETQAAVLIFRGMADPKKKQDPNWLLFNDELNLIIKARKARKAAPSNESDKEIAYKHVICCICAGADQQKAEDHNYQVSEPVSRLIMGSVWFELKKKAVNWLQTLADGEALDP